MAIKVNGTTITYVKVNGTNINTVKVGSTSVFERAIGINKWVYITYESSEPTYQYYAYANWGSTQEDWVNALERDYPARDLAVGTMGYVIIQGDTIYPILQVQEV